MVVSFAVHLKDNVDVIMSLEEALTIVLNHPLLKFLRVSNNDFLIVSLIVLSIGGGNLGTKFPLLIRKVHRHVSSVLLKTHFNQLVVPLLKEMDSILVSEHDVLELSDDVVVNRFKVIIDSLPEDHVVDKSIDFLRDCSQSIDSMSVNVL